MTSPAHQQPYVLGNDAAELERLDRQSASIEPPTRSILEAAGIGAGQRVLDLGTGLGHVARLAGALVGRQGAVVGVDESSEHLAVARRRVADAGERHVSFVDGDVRRWRGEEPFDAVTGRLILFHLVDPVSVVRHHLNNLRPGGAFVAIDFDIGNCGTVPAVPFINQVFDWVMRAFNAAGAAPRIGARLGPILRDAGLCNVTTFGIQGYLQPGDPAAGYLLGSVIRSLAKAIVAHGIATSEQLGLETLERRIVEALAKADAVLLMPTLVGAWGRAPETNRGNMTA